MVSTTSNIKRSRKGGEKIKKETTWKFLIGGSAGGVLVYDKELLTEILSGNPISCHNVKVTVRAYEFDKKGHIITEIVNGECQPKIQTIDNGVISLKIEVAKPKNSNNSQ